jgi:riboflavin kinase / FMN adenylyltransferase
MDFSRGLSNAALHASTDVGCALTMGTFDGVHRGHQAMLALLVNEARHRGLKACVMTFEPHPRDVFARWMGKPESAPPRVAPMRDKLIELKRCGVDHVVVMPFGKRMASMSPEAFVQDVVVRALKTRYVLVGDDFRFGAKRAGDYAMLDAMGEQHGFDVARMQSYEVHGQRVSSSAVREALGRGDLSHAQSLLGHPVCLSARVQHGRKLGRELGFPTLNLRLRTQRSAAQGIFVASVEGLADQPLEAVASLGTRPSVEDEGRLILEVHCLDWPASLGREGGYGRCVRVTLHHKLHDELAYSGLDTLKAGIAKDVADAKAWWAARRLQFRPS